MKTGIKQVLTAGVLAGAVLLGGCGGKINPASTVVNINDGKDKITIGYANFTARYAQASMESMFGNYIQKGYWQESTSDDSGETMEDSSKTSVMETMKEEYVCKEHASEYGVTITDEDKTAITEAAKKFMESNDEDAISHIGATQEYVEQMLTDLTYRNRVQKAVKEEAQVEVTDEECIQSKISYVFFSNTTTEEDTGEEVELEDEELNELKATAEEISNASDFSEAAESAGLDVRDFTYTASDEEFENMSVPNDVVIESKKLADKQTSDVIETDEGFYVVYMAEKNDEDATKVKRQSIESEKKTEVYNDKIESWQSEVKWDVVESQWKLVKYDSMFTAKAVASDDEEETEEE